VSGIYGNVGQTNYGAAKAGIASFTIIAALELARLGVTVNAVAPVALTRMTEGLGAAPETDEEREMRSPRWIAPIVTWLAGSEAGHVTGRIFEASGQTLAVARGLAPRPVHHADRRPDQARPRRRGPAEERTRQRRHGRQGRQLAAEHARKVSADGTKEQQGDTHGTQPSSSRQRRRAVPDLVDVEGLAAVRGEPERQLRPTGVRHRELNGRHSEGIANNACCPWLRTRNS